MKENSEESTLAAVWPAVATVIGIAFIAIGLVWPSMTSSAKTLSKQQAEEYYAASTALEKAAASRSRKSRGNKQPEIEKEKIEAARLRFDSAKQEVAEAQSNSKKPAFWLKIIGGVLAITGASGLLIRQS